MLQTAEHIELLEAIQKKLKRGDINEIARRSGFSRDHVSRCLSIAYENHFRMDIVDCAINLINEREQDTKKKIKERLRKLVA